MATKTETVECIVKGMTPDSQFFLIDIVKGKYPKTNVKFKKDLPLNVHLNVGDCFKTDMSHKWLPRKSKDDKWEIDYYYTTAPVILINKEEVIQFFFAPCLAFKGIIENINRQEGSYCPFFYKKQNSFVTGTILITKELCSIPFNVVYSANLCRTGESEFKVAGPLTKNTTSYTVIYSKTPNSSEVWYGYGHYFSFDPCWDGLPMNITLVYKGDMCKINKIYDTNRIKNPYETVYENFVFDFYHFDKKLFDLNKDNIQTALEEFENQEYYFVLQQFIDFGLWNKASEKKLKNKDLKKDIENFKHTSNSIQEDIAGKTIAVYSDYYFNYSTNKSDTLLDVCGNPAGVGSYIFLIKNSTGFSSTKIFVAQIDSFFSDVSDTWGSPTRKPDDLDIYTINKQKYICHGVDVDTRCALCFDLTYPDWLSEYIDRRKIDLLPPLLGYDNWEVVDNG